MRRTACVLALLALISGSWELGVGGWGPEAQPLAPAPPAYLSAQWDSADSATVHFTLAARGCLYRESRAGERAFVSCYERFPATIIVTFGHAGSLSGDLRPQAGDVYRLDTGGHSYRASLRGRDVYLAAWRA